MLSDSMPSVQVAAWFAELPLADARCNNDSCAAYLAAHQASQAEVSWASQFLYGHYIAWFYAVVILLFVANHAANIFLPLKSSSATTRPGPRDRLSAVVRTFSYRQFKRPSFLLWSLPSWGVLSLSALFLVAALAMAFAQQPYYRPKRGYGSPPLGVRTGLMAYALVPVEFALAGKVSLLGWMTGIGHEKLNALHRVVGWLLLLLALIHTVPFFVQVAREGGAAQVHAQFYKPGGFEFTGVPPLGMLVGLVVLSAAPLRRMAYEAFVHMHVVLAVVFFGLLFWHAGDELDSWAYLWATMAIWLSSLAVRMFGKTSLFGLRGTWFSQSRATLTRLPGNMVKVEVQAPAGWRWEPGQHVFLRFLRLRPLDNHPFTIANAAPERAGGAVTSPTTSMVFYVRPHGGITGRIGALADAGGELGVSLDGPYGTVIRPRVERRFDGVVLVAGGGGVSGLLPWLDHLSREMAANMGCTVGSATLVWVVRTRECVSWVAQELATFRDRAPPGSVKLDIWVTDQDRRDGGVAGERDAEKGDVASKYGEMLLEEMRFSGRPVLEQILPLMVGSGRTLVLGCGPESLKIDLSNVTARLQSRVARGEAVEVRLHTESFGW